MKPDLAGAVLVGADVLVADWVAARLPDMAVRGARFGGCTAFGIVGPAGLMGGVVFTRWTGHDIEVAGAVVPGFRCSPDTLRRILAYPFAHLGCTRLSMEIPRGNAPARRFAERLGFRVEGVKPSGLQRRKDTILYGLQRSECRFLRGHDHG